MEQIPEYLSEAFITVFLNEHVWQLDNDEDWRVKIEELRSNSSINAKNVDEITAWISYLVEDSCLTNECDAQGALTIMAQVSYLYSRALGSKLGTISDLFGILVQNYNRNRVR